MASWTPNKKDSGVFSSGLDESTNRVTNRVTNEVTNEVTNGVTNGVSDLISKNEYVFKEQLWYDELDKIIQYNRFDKKYSKDEVNELIKNDIIKEAYIKWTTLTLVVDDEKVKTSTVTWVKTDFWTDIEMDYSEAIETPEWTYEYPNTFLAFYHNLNGNHFSSITKNWVFSSNWYYEKDKDFYLKYSKLLKSKWVIQLNNNAYDNEQDFSDFTKKYSNIDDLLVDRGIKKFYKKAKK